METFEKWEPIDGIVYPIGGIELDDSLETGLMVRLIFDKGKETLDSPRQDLIIHFGQVEAYAWYEENAGPMTHDKCGILPVVESPIDGRQYRFPCLQVTGSRWLGSATDIVFSAYSSCKHYRFLCLDGYLDVITGQEPRAEWVEVESALIAEFRSMLDQHFFLSIGEEIGPGKCMKYGCDRLTVQDSWKCRLHHFMQFKHYDPKVRESQQ